MPCSVFFFPAPWIGERAGRLAILALALYGLLPLIRNTYAGIPAASILVWSKPGARMGLTNWQLLYQVDCRSHPGIIVAGVRIAAVLSIGLATIAAAIGAGDSESSFSEAWRWSITKSFWQEQFPPRFLALLDRPLRLDGSNGDCRLCGTDREQRDGEREATMKSSIRQFRRVGILLVPFCFCCQSRAAKGTRTASLSARRTLPSNSSSARCSLSLSRLELTCWWNAVFISRALSSASKRSLAGRIDLYPEYTGTALTAVLKQQPSRRQAR